MPWKAAHLLALGLWSGAVLFFSFFVALPVIDQMKTHASDPSHWLHAKEGSTVGLKDSKDGIRVAGEMLDVVFSRYFLFQIGCGIVAFLTSLRWISTPGRISKFRMMFCGLALSLAFMNQFIFAKRVHDLRNLRYDSDQEKAALAEKNFQGAHNLSLIADMVGLLFILFCLLSYPARNATPDSQG